MHLPELGIGLVLWKETAFLLDRCANSVDAIEIEPESFWLPTPNGGFRHDAETLAFLQAIPHPKLVHSVSFPVGGTVAPDARGLALLREIVQTLGSPWASMHLSFNQTGKSDRTNAGFLLPPLQTDEGVALAARNLLTAADALGVPMAFETGVNYLRPTRGAMRDGAFVAAVAEEADCGILLDLHNIWVNAQNGRQSVEDFLAEIPLERVWEIHVAGGELQDGYWLDAHSRVAPAEILELVAQVAPRLPNLKAIIFEMLPPYAPSLRPDDLLRQMDALRDAWSQRGTKAHVPRSAAAPRPSGRVPGVSPERWETMLTDQLNGSVGRGPFATSLSKDLGIGLYRRLIQEARAGAIIDAVKLTCRRILLHDPDVLDTLVQEYVQASRPALFAALEAIGFLEFAIPRLREVPGVADVANLEHALLGTMIDGGRRTVVFQGNPLVVVEALAQRRAPPREAGIEVFTLVVENGVVVSANVGV